jgi:uncharacterized protein YraI
MPTIQPMIAVAQTNVTLRSGPRKGSDNIGGIFTNQKVQVIARNLDATWYYIIANDVPGGRAWVLARGFKLEGELTQLPIAYSPDNKDPFTILPPLIWTFAGTPLPPNTPGPDGRKAVILQQANVRVGPTVGYMTIGILGPGTVVSVTGRIEGNGWLQIDFPSGPDGRGWVLKSLVQYDGAYAGLPFYNLMATPVAKPGQSDAPTAVPATVDPNITPTATPVPPTPTEVKPYGVTLGQINARSGPAASFDSYGLIDQNQQVILTGQTLNGVWLQIEYPASPTGRAWVAAEYVKIMSDIRTLPYFDNSGNPLKP